MAQVRLRDVVKRYGRLEVLDDLSLTIEDGEFVALVGSSGCGKTTTLNLIAGLLELSDGEIFIGDRLVNDLDPKDRDITHLLDRRPPGTVRWPAVARRARSCPRA
jgi:multiple sugar transport system ATP-binding protein